MHRPLFATFTTAALVVAWQSAAQAAPSHGKPASRTARVMKTHACTKPPVEVVSGKDTEAFSLADCSGNALPTGVDQLSVLARPSNAAKPKDKITASGRTTGPNVAPGIRRVDPRLVERIEQVVGHFFKDGRGARMELISGYRPKSTGSYHSSGRALDFRLEGVKNEEIVAFCKTLPDTGCGYYPNSLFVHLDVRERGAGHISWIDASRPGEPPRYVTAWPPQGGDIDGPPRSVLPALPEDEHTNTPAPEQSNKPGSPMFF
jgi:hypothetical protein